MRSIHQTSIMTALISLCAISCGSMSHVHRHETVHFLPNLKEIRLTVTGKPTIEESTSECRLEIEGYVAPDGDRTIYIAKSRRFPALDKTVEYTFELYESWQKHDFYKKGLYHNALASIKQGRKVLYDGSLCALHHCKMKRVVMRIDAIGDTPFTIGKASASQFPNNGVLYARENSAFCAKRISWQCPECIASEANWKGRPANRNSFPKDYYFWEAHKESYSHAAYQ
jgi:hypothetical protein